MAKEIKTTATTGSTLYALVVNSSDQYWYTVTPVFEAYNAAHWSSYAIALTEDGASGRFSGSFPTAINTNGIYSVTAYMQAGGSPAIGDSVIAGPGDISWNGTAEVAANNTIVSSGTLTTVSGNVAGTVGGGTVTTGSYAGSAGTVVVSSGIVTTVSGNVAGSVGSVSGAVGSVAAGVTVTTNSDKSGYSLTQSFPAGFSTLSIVAGAVSLQGGQTVGVSGGTITTVTGAVGSVAGAVGSVSGNVGGSVASVMGVTFPSGFGTLSVVGGGVALQAGQNVNSTNTVNADGSTVTATNTVTASGTMTVGNFVTGSLAAAAFANGAITSASLASGAIVAIQNGLSTPSTAQTIVPNQAVNVNEFGGTSTSLLATFPLAAAGTLSTFAGGAISATVAGYASGQDPYTILMAGAVDDLTIAQLFQHLRSFFNCKDTVVDNGNGTSTITFYQSNGSTIAFSATFNQTTGARAAIGGNP